MSNSSPSLTAAGITAVAIVERTAYGEFCYYAECLTCGWRCYLDRGHDGSHTRQDTALRHGKAHACKGSD